MGKKKKSTATEVKNKSPRNTESDSPEPNKWTFFTNHAHVLILLYTDPDLVLRQIAAHVGITERAVQRIVHDLEKAGFIERERIGRRNRYHVVRNQYMRHPIEEHCKIDDLIDFIVSQK